jgi:hypothetical protein
MNPYSENQPSSSLNGNNYPGNNNTNRACLKVIPKRKWLNISENSEAKPFNINVELNGIEEDNIALLVLGFQFYQQKQEGKGNKSRKIEFQIEFKGFRPNNSEVFVYQRFIKNKTKTGIPKGNKPKIKNKTKTGIPKEGDKPKVELKDNKITFDLSGTSDVEGCLCCFTLFTKNPVGMFLS